MCETTSLALAAGGEEGVTLVSANFWGVDGLDEVDVGDRGFAGVDLVFASANAAIHME
ncbi:MAG: hypothetical protein SGPRY_007332 [Prymnesium sp.]